MKARLRLSAAFVPIAIMTLLAPLVPDGAPSAAAQQPLASATPVLSQAEGPAPAPDRARVTEALRSSPVMFIENVGQFDERARFQVRGGTGTMWLTEDAIWVTVLEQPDKETRRQGDKEIIPLSPPHLVSPSPQRGVNLHFSFVGANPHPRLEPFDQQETVVSYFIGNDPAKWHPDVPVWGGVRYVDLYPGIDLELTSAGGQYTQRLVPRPGADLSAVRLRVAGAEAVALDGDRLRLTTAVGHITWSLLEVPLDVGALNLDRATWNVPLGTFEMTAPFMVARPSADGGLRTVDQGLGTEDNPDDLLYSTFLGGGSSRDAGEDGYALAVDGAGNAYVTGWTNSSDFPTTPGAFDRSYGGDRDAFVAKLNAAGSSLLYATFLGGSDEDGDYALAVDGAGNAYVTGRTDSSDFPTTPGAFDRSLGAYRDAFVAKLVLGGGDAKRPVVLLPGGSASVNWPCFLWEIGCDIPSLWGWFPILAQEVYQPLIDELVAARYTEDNHYLGVLFYDWRKPISDNVATLKVRINELKAATGAAEVDLIGHSMGGLVARAYIQDSTYGNDVAHLITLGSPHQGAAKAYPYWEAANFYRVSDLEKIVFSIILLYYMRRETNPIPVYTLRKAIPSFRDILPTADYLYDEQRGDQVKPEAGMAHRNAYMVGLNADLATLFARTDTSTFVGQNLETPVRFYVHDRSWWEWPNWDDGEPNWSREPEFMCIWGDCTLGDETVAAASAELPSPAHVQPFHGVNHGDLPGSNTVISAIFTTLGISISSYAQAASEADQTDQQMIVLVLDGPADVTVTDPLGRSVGPGGTSIPGAEYVSDPSDPFKLILIPGPEEGNFEIDVQGYNSETYALSLLDTFSPTPTVIPDVMTLWDTSQSQIEPATTVSFALTYILEIPEAPPLIAVTPVIEVPVRVGDTAVHGRALPGYRVEARDANTHALLGSGMIDAYGHFAVLLSAPLGFGQRVYPWSNGVAGVPVTAEAYEIYLPAVRK